MTPPDKAFSLLCLASAAGIFFGLWQNDWRAGLFMFCALCVLDQRS
jgi:hypothetical protein